MLDKKYKEVCEDLDWRVNEDEETIELGRRSPAGEDFFFSVDVENFVEDVKKYAFNFDTEEHIEMWIDARKNGVRGVPSIRELVQDADEIQKMLQELAEALQKAENSTEF